MNAVDYPVSPEAANSPLVSVIMNCYNGEAYLREAIDSVLAQDYQHWELVFFNNASTDGTANIVKGYDDPRIRYLSGTVTVPLGEARNLAIREARGEFIAFLDTDDRWLPEKIGRQLRCFNEQPDCGFVYSNYYIIKPSGKRKRLGLRGKQPEGDVFAAFVRQYPINLQTVMIRASVLNSIDGLFDPALELSEEYDLFMRLLYYVRAAYIKQPLVEYRVHGQMSSIKKMERYPAEFATILDRLARMIPGFEDRYHDALLDARAKLGYYQARVMMAEGRGEPARQLLRQHFVRGVSYKALYLLTYLGSRGWRLAHRWVGRIV